MTSLRHALTGLAIAGLHGTAAAQAAACPTPMASYAVAWLGDDQFGVTATLGLPTTRFDLRFSEAIGRPEGQAASVSALEGWDAGGRSVAIDYVGEGGWEAAAPVRRIGYRLTADHDDVRWTGGGMDEVASHFGETYFFVGNAFFLLDYDWPPCPIEVAFELPADWSVLSPWSGTGRNFEASEPATLEKNAFAVGNFTAGHADAGTMQLSWVIDERVASVASELIPMMRTLPGVYARWFGSTPADRYAVVVFQGPYPDGGAFRQSFTLQLMAPVRAIDRISWGHGLAHEMIHLWLGNHVRGVDPERVYWFTEGFTDYLAIKLAFQAGQLDEARLQQRLANLVRRVRQAGRLSPGVGLVEAGSAKGSHWERIYGGGAMIALLIDAQHPAGFKAAMRELVRDGAEPFTHEQILERIDRHTDGAATRAFDLINDGGDLGTILVALGQAGVEFTAFGPDEVYVGWSACDSSSCVPGFLLR
jgi:predicted metalloprotease with PDZ domain